MDRVELYQHMDRGHPTLRYSAKRENIFDHVCPIVISEVPEKQKPGKRSCVIVLDTPSHFQKCSRISINFYTL